MSTIRLTGLASGLDTDSMVEEMMSGYYDQLYELEGDQERLEWTEDAWDDMNTELYDFYKSDLFTFKSTGTYTAKSITSTDSSVATFDDSDNAVYGTQELTVTQTAEGSYLTGDEISDSNGDAYTATTSTTVSDLLGIDEADTLTIQVKSSATGDYTDIELTGSSTISEVLSAIEDATGDSDTAVSANLDTTNQRIFLTSDDTGEDVEISLAADTDSTGADLLAALGFSLDDTDGDGTAEATGTTGQNALYTYNGTELESSSNDVTVNGLEFTITGTGTTTVTVSQDTDAIYEAVKSFITSYNTLLADIIEAVEADDASDYDMLTDDEEEEMTDDEIESWNEYIKEGLLSGDDILESLQDMMRSVLTGSTGLDTSDLDYSYLSELGIVTGDYTEEGLLHIEGDEDDADYSTDDNTLLEAIEENPDGVIEFLTALGSTLYSKLADKMSTSETSSALTFYNDKSMDDEIDDYDDEIEDLEDKIETMEDRYYDQFSAMETAISEANSQSSWLTSLLSS